MSPITVMLWAGAVLVWLATTLAVWVVLEFITDALKAHRAAAATEGGDEDA